jgi:hypothetical protein
MIPRMNRKLLSALVLLAFSCGHQLFAADDLGCQVSCYGEKRFSTPRHVPSMFRQRG